MIPAIPYIPPNMIELLRAFEAASREIDQLKILRAADFASYTLIPRAWPRQWEIDAISTRRGSILVEIEERSRQLLAATLDEFHGSDPTLAAEVQAFTLWKLVSKA